MDPITDSKFDEEEYREYDYDVEECCDDNYIGEDYYDDGYNQQWGGSYNDHGEEFSEFVYGNQGLEHCNYDNSTPWEVINWEESCHYDHDYYGAANGSTENNTYSSSIVNHDQHAEPHSRNIQDGLTMTSVASTSNSGTPSVSQAYASYAAYPNADTYGYGSTGYAGYYSGYQEQSNLSYPQLAGAYQSTGAPHQPISSFQNIGSYAGPASYSTTYYNPGGYQTSGGYPVATYNNQTNLWNQGSYASYGHQCPNYTAESNGAYSATNASATSLQYQQEYRQWADYYSQTEVSCAPGTENISATSKSNLGCPVPAVASMYSAPTSQQVASSTPSSWGTEPSSSEVPSVQPSVAIANVHDEYWKHWGPGFQNYHVSSLQPNFQKPEDLNPTPGSFQDHQKPEYPQGPSLQYSATHQAPQYYQPPMQAAPQTAVPFDSGRVSKVHIPTNPRIASNLPMVLPKNDNPAMGGVTKPAYVRVSLPKPNDKVPSHVAGDSVLKPGMLPKSLHGYVERALARCKDDRQMTACQDVLKEFNVFARLIFDPGQRGGNKIVPSGFLPIGLVDGEKHPLLLAVKENLLTKCCLGNCWFSSVVVALVEVSCISGVETIEDCVGWHEEDHGILWKPQDGRTSLTEVGKLEAEVVEVGVQVEGLGSTNAHNMFYSKETLLEYEVEAMGDYNHLSTRHWIIKNTILTFPKGYGTTIDDVVALEDEGSRRGGKEKFVVFVIGIDWFWQKRCVQPAPNHSNSSKMAARASDLGKTEPGLFLSDKWVLFLPYEQNFNAGNCLGQVSQSRSGGFIFTQVLAWFLSKFGVFIRVVFDPGTSLKVWLDTGTELARKRKRIVFVFDPGGEIF